MLHRLLTGFAVVWLTAAVACATAGPVSAATVRMDGSVLRFEAGPGETNVVSFESGHDITVVDRGSSVPTPGDGCAQAPGGDPHRVECQGAVTSASVELGDGDDSLDGNLYGREAPLSVSAGDGADVVQGGWGLARADGGAGDDRLSGGGTLVGGDGADFLDAHNTAEGGPGDDVLVGGPVSSLSGGPGDDDIRGAAGSYDMSMAGDEGNDRISEADGPVDGGPGNDVIETRRGSATGGGGDDRIVLGSDTGSTPDDTRFVQPASTFVDRRREPVTTCVASTTPWLSTLAFRDPRPDVDGGEGNDEIIGSGADNWLVGGGGMDRIATGSGSDAADGGTGDDVVDGAAGKDLLVGGPGDDQITGGQGDDRLDGGAGADGLSGGDGAADELCYDDHPAGVTVDLTAPGGDGSPGERDSVGDDVERLSGSRFDDVLIAAARPTELRGGDGNDRLAGSPAADMIEGGFGSDQITGGDGNDRLSGGPEYRQDAGQSVVSLGSDRIEGGRGNDEITGQRGADFLSGGPGDDRISGSESSEGFVGIIGAYGQLNHSPVISLAHEDQLWCGSGIDQVEAGYPDSLAADCEIAAEGTPRWRRVRLSGRGSFNLRVRCAWRSSAPCKGSARVIPAADQKLRGNQPRPLDQNPPPWCPLASRPTADIAQARLKLRAGRVGALRLTLTPRGRHAVARRGCVAARISLQIRARDGSRYAATRTLLLTRRGFKPPRRTTQP